MVDIYIGFHRDIKSTPILAVKSSVELVLVLCCWSAYLAAGLPALFVLGGDSWSDCCKVELHWAGTQRE